MQKILSFFKNRIEYIENKKVTFLSILFSIYIAAIIRAYLEGFSNILNQGKASSFVDTFFHYPLWYFGVFLSIYIILILITKENLFKVSKLFIYSPFLTITPVIFDVILNKGSGVYYTYIKDDLFSVLINFFNYYNPVFSNGIKIEILIGFVFLGFYIFIKTRSFKKILIGLSSVFVALFIFATIPKTLMDFYNIIFQKSTESISLFFQNNILNSVLIDRTFVTSLDPAVGFLEQKINNQISYVPTIFITIIDFLLLSWFLWIYNKNKFIAVVKNFRYLRILSYLSVSLFGMYVGLMNLNIETLSYFDFIYIFSAFLAFLFAGLFCIWENDEIDLEIDKISNPERPLPSKVLSIKEWNIIKYTFLFFGFNFAFLSGFYILILFVIFISLYHVYSKPPWRFKSVIGLSSLIISFNILLFVWVGYFIVSGNENLSSFPIVYSLFILISAFLIENIKNIKDIEGDKKNGIKTIPNLLGEEKSKLVLGFILAVFCFIFPFVIYLNIKTLITSIVFALIMFLVMNKEKFEEKYVFITYFVYIFFFVLGILF